MEDAGYFIKFAVGSYGWALYVFMNPCAGPLNLCGGLRYGTAGLHMSLRFLVSRYMHSVGRKSNSQEVVLVVFLLFSMKVARVHAYSFKGKLIRGSQPFMVALLLSVVLDMLGNLKLSKQALYTVGSRSSRAVSGSHSSQKSKSYLTKNKHRNCAIL